jgi:hypothetical protein
MTKEARTYVDTQSAHKLEVNLEDLATLKPRVDSKYNIVDFGSPHSLRKMEGYSRQGGPLDPDPMVVFDANFWGELEACTNNRNKRGAMSFAKVQG